MKILGKIRVLLVEDDPMVQEIQRRFISNVDGFCVAASAGTGAEALALLGKTPVDLVILDIFMPEMDGVELLHRVREKGKKVDVIIVSASQEAETIHDVLRFGAFDYLVKPFTFERFRMALESYRGFFSKVKREPRAFTQGEIDEMFRRRQKADPRDSLPKGLQPQKLGIIIGLLRQSRVPLSADEVALLAATSRVTARRYLEYLVSIDRAVVEPLYREVGRPVNRFRLID